MIASSNEIRDIYNEQYNCEIKFFETTSLYGSLTNSSQYDGLKPYYRRGGLTESNSVPAPTDKIMQELYVLLERFKCEENGKLFGIWSGSKKSKRLVKIYSLVLNKLKEFDQDKHDELKRVMGEKRDSIQTQKLYYYSTYGVGNIKDHIAGASPIMNIPVERFDMDSLVTWWKKKAQKRFDNLRYKNMDKHELELWTDDNIDSVKFQIVR